MIMASEKIVDGTPINAGISKLIKLKDVAERIFEIVGWRPKKIYFDKTKPVGVFARTADLTNSTKLLGWEPKTSFDDGIRNTIDWYYATKKKSEVKKSFETLLFNLNVM